MFMPIPYPFSPILTLVLAEAEFYDDNASVGLVTSFPHLVLQAQE